MYYTFDTWLPKFQCDNSICKVQPISQSSPIRNTCKYDSERLKGKFELIINNWNQNNPIIAYEGMTFDFTEIAKEGKKWVKK